MNKYAIQGTLGTSGALGPRRTNRIRALAQGILSRTRARLKRAENALQHKAPLHKLMYHIKDVCIHVDMRRWACWSPCVIPWTWQFCLEPNRRIHYRERLECLPRGRPSSKFLDWFVRIKGSRKVCNATFLDIKQSLNKSRKHITCTADMKTHVPTNVCKSHAEGGNVRNMYNAYEHRVHTMWKYSSMQRIPPCQCHDMPRKGGARMSQTLVFCELEIIAQ